VSSAAPESRSPTSGLLAGTGGGSGAPGGPERAPAARQWISLEAVFQAHSRQLTEAASRLAVTVGERPDLCQRGHPKTSRCPECHQRSRRGEPPEACQRGHRLTPDNLIETTNARGHRERRCRACKQRNQQRWTARRAREQLARQGQSAP
jgi:hypothetical protein